MNDEIKAYIDEKITAVKAEILAELKPVEEKKPEEEPKPEEDETKKEMLTLKEEITNIKKELIKSNQTDEKKTNNDNIYKSIL